MPMLERIEASPLKKLETVFHIRYGKQGEWWDYYETDLNRLWTRRN